MVDIKKASNESELQYIWRICSAKDSGLLDVTWEELAIIMNNSLYPDETEWLGESAYRKKYQQAKAFYDEVFSKMISDEYHQQIAKRQQELQKERYKFFDERNAYNKLLRTRARQEEINEIIDDVVNSGNLPALNFTREEQFVISDCDMLISLTDIHYGANIKNAWNVYNSDVCRERFVKYLNAIIDIQSRHQTENAVVWCNGDEISGNIHNEITITNKENVIEQIKGVSELIAEFLAELSKHFNQVIFVSVAGNHSRIETNKDRALVAERLDDLVEWYLSARLQTFENVVIGTPNITTTAAANSVKIDNTMYLIDIRGKTYCGVHGDFDGSSGKVQSLQTMAGKPLYAILSGHMHHNKIDEVQGVKTIMAGSFIGMDDYCVQKRIVGRAEQMVCVCDADGVRCSYGIPLQ